MKPFDAKITQQIFEDSVVELCKTLPHGKVKILDSILSQEKNETEILKDIVGEFPNFSTIYSLRLMADK